MENQFIRLLFETGENREALGTVQDAATHGTTACPIFFLLNSCVLLFQIAHRRGCPSEVLLKNLLGLKTTPYDWAW
jgi:hypothetical protein